MKTLILIILLTLAINIDSQCQDCSTLVNKQVDKFDKSIRYYSKQTLVFKDGNKIITVRITGSGNSAFHISFECKTTDGKNIRIIANPYVYFLFDDNSSEKIYENIYDYKYEDPSGEIVLPFHNYLNTKARDKFLTSNVTAIRIDFDGWPKDFDLKESEKSYFKSIVNCMNF